MFAINQRIVCCDDDFSKTPQAFLKYYSAFPRKGSIYRVRDITQGIGGEVACLLHEIHNPPNLKGIENGFNVERFAPLDEEPAEEVAAESANYTLASFTA